MTPRMMALVLLGMLICLVWPQFGTAAHTREEPVGSHTDLSSRNRMLPESEGFPHGAQPVVVPKSALFGPLSRMESITEIIDKVSPEGGKAGGQIEIVEYAVQRSSVPRVEATIIDPFRICTVPAEVGGIIEEFKFKQGELIHEGEVVVEISPKRYRLMVRKAREKLNTLRVALKYAQKDLAIARKLLSMDAGTVQDVERAETEVELTKSKITVGQVDLDQALLDLQACQVTAPFTGYLARRYKHPFEAIGPLEKLFTIVDSAKVYAVANVPLELVSKFKKGKEAVFTDSAGRRMAGVVERVEQVVDPKTETKKVYVLIDNENHVLEVGMSGSLESKH